MAEPYTLAEIEVPNGRVYKLEDTQARTDIDIIKNRINKFTTMWFGTRDEYNRLPYIDPNICYCIEEGT